MICCISPKKRYNAFQRIEKQLDICRFVRKQIQIECLLKYMTTKVERALVYKNRCFDLNVYVDSTSEDDYLDIKSIETESPLSKRLKNSLGIESSKSLRKGNFKRKKSFQMKKQIVVSPIL